MINYYTRLLAMASLALIQTSVQAQSQAMEEIRVIADPLGGVDEHIIQPTRVLNSDELKSRSIQNIGETVSRELGVTSSDYGAGSGRPIIRGLSGGRVKVMENNIGTMDASTISPDHGVTAEPVFAEQIEILRGPATLLYGSGASGGLVNIINERIPDHMPDGFEGNAIIQYETVNKGRTGAAKVNAGDSNMAIHLSGMLRDSSDYRIPGATEPLHDEDDHQQEEELEQAGRVENSAVKTTNVTGGLSYIGDRGFIGVAVGGLNSKYGIPGAHGRHEEDEDEHDVQDGGVTVDLKQIRYDFRAALENPLPGIHELRSSWGFNDYEHDEIEPDGDVGTSFKNKELEGRIELIHNPVGVVGLNGALGFQITDREFSAIGEEAFVLPSEQDSLAIFLLEKADLSNWHFGLGVRYEHVNSASITGDTVNHNLYSISGSASWDYSPGYELGLTLGRAQRAPTIEELYSNGPHLATNTFDIGDTGLQKESPHNIDMHWRKTEGRITTAANLFYNRINNFIYQQTQDLNNDGIADRVEEDFDGDIADILDPDHDDELLLLIHSQANARLYGIELETSLNLINDQRGILDLRLWTDYVRGKLTNNGGNLPRISPWRIGAGLVWDQGPWSFNLDFTHTGKQSDTSELEDSTAGHEMLNLYGGYDFNVGSSSFTVFVRGTNLLNQQIRRHTSFVKNIAPLPGRSGIIGVRASF